MIANPSTDPKDGLKGARLFEIANDKIEEYGDKNNTAISSARLHNPKAGIRPISSTGVAMTRSAETG